MEQLLEKCARQPSSRVIPFLPFDSDADGSVDLSLYLNPLDHFHARNFCFQFLSRDDS
jgi:hypothetical protein